MSSPDPDTLSYLPGTSVSALDIAVFAGIIASATEMQDIAQKSVQHLCKLTNAALCCILVVDNGAAQIIASINDILESKSTFRTNVHPDIENAIALRVPIVAEARSGQSLLRTLMRCHAMHETRERDAQQTEQHSESLDKEESVLVLASLATESPISNQPAHGSVRNETSQREWLLAVHLDRFDNYKNTDTVRIIAGAASVALRNAFTVDSLVKDAAIASFARREAEQRAQLLKRYAAFFESGADGIVVTDLEGQILFANAKARSITGFSETALRCKNIDDLAITSDQPQLRDIRNGLPSGNYPKYVEVRFDRSNNTRVVLGISVSDVLQDESSVLFGFRDISRERAIRNELQQTKDILDRVTDVCANALLFVDAMGIVRHFNRAAERCLGWKADQVIGRMNAFDMLPAEEAEALMRILRSDRPDSTTHVDCHQSDAFRSTANVFASLSTIISDDASITPGTDTAASGSTSTSSIAEHSATLRSASGETVPVTLCAMTVHDGSRRAGAVVVLTDLRYKFRVEAQLAAAHVELETRERQAIIAELAGAAAHELNQPLTSVMGYAELLKRKVYDNPTAFSAVEVIMSEAERMAGIVRKIGRITRYETKSYVGNAKILDLDRAGDEPVEHMDRGGDC